MAYGGTSVWNACRLRTHAVGCGVCDTPEPPELWRGAAGPAGLCARLRARVLMVPPNLYIHTYIHRYMCGIGCIGVDERGQKTTTMPVVLQEQNLEENWHSGLLSSTKQRLPEFDSSRLPQVVRLCGIQVSASTGAGLLSYIHTAHNTPTPYPASPSGSKRASCAARSITSPRDKWHCTPIAYVSVYMCGIDDDIYTPERHLLTSGQRGHGPQRHTAAVAQPPPPP